MKGVFLLAAIAVGANAAVLENRQGRHTDRPGNSQGGAPAPPAATSPPDGTSSHNQKREPQGPWLSIGNPYQSISIVPSNPLDLSKCGLDAFVGHTSEALLFCSSILKGGTATSTTTYTERATTTTRTTVYTTLYPPSAPSSAPSSGPTPPVSTPGRPTSTSASASAPAPTSSQSCGLYGYTGATAAYYFDSSGTKNNFTACSAACKADAKCKSFGYGEANCMLFDVPAGNNVAINPLSPYTFYDVSCPVELPVRRRQVQVTLTQRDVTSACSCLITSGAADVTKTATTTVTSVRVTLTQTVTRTVSLLPDHR